MTPKTTMFFDVNTQRDFILPDGKLSVKGVERIVPTLAALTTLAHRLNIRIVASVDRHFPGDPELIRNGGKYPDHCMDGTPGQRKIDETAPLKPLYIENRDMTEAELETALAHRGEIVIEKQRFDVFAGNRNAPALLAQLLSNYSDVVIYGVYTEVCVAGAVNGMLRLRGPNLHIVTDAIADIGADAPAYLAAWKASGVELLTFAELERQLSQN